MDSRDPPLARQPPRLPLWVRLADAAACVLALLVLWRVLSGGARGGVLHYLIPFASAQSLLFTLGSVLLVRHVGQPSPSALARLRDRIRRTGDSPEWGPAARAFVATRLMVFVVGLFAVATIGFSQNPGFTVSREVLVNLPARFDAGWYAGIALSGYTWNARFDRQANIAFFPAMPLLMQVVGHAVGARDSTRSREIRTARLLWSGVAISLTAFLFALVYLVKVGRAIVGEERAGIAVLLLASYPFAFAFNAPYTESLFLLSSLATVHHFQKREWIPAIAWGLLTGLTRPNGFFLSIPLGLIVLQQMWQARQSGVAGWLRAGASPLTVAATPVAGMLAYTIYLFSLTGTWFAWSRSHGAWGRTFEGAEPMVSAWTMLREHGFLDLMVLQPFNALNTFAVLFALAMIWPVHRTLGSAWAAYVLLTIIPPLVAGGVLSMGRVTSTLFPLFLALAAIASPRAAPHWVAAFAILQGLCVALFFTWRQLY